MQAPWLRKQSGQAIVLVAIGVLVLTAILALALDGGSIYLDKRQLQNAADAAALSGAELLMTVPPSYPAIHNQAVGILVKNLPGTSLAGTVCSASCPNQQTIGTPGMSGIGSIDLGAGYFAELSITTSESYQVSIWHAHAVIVAPIHGFQPTITLLARATAQNGDLPYAVVALQDSATYAQWADVNIQGPAASLALQGGGGTADHGGVFTNADIAPGAASPAISFSPAGNAGDLWAVDESGADQSALNAAGRVTGQQTPGTLPLVASHLDSPAYPEPPPPSTTFGASSVSSGTSILCPGQYTGQIGVASGATAILFPGVYQVQDGGVNVQGTMRSVTSADLPVTACGKTLNPGADLGVIVEVRPGNTSGSTQCDKNVFFAGTTSTVALSPSTKYFNVSLYIETMANWQTTCTSQPFGTNVVSLASGACYNIAGTTYAPADNIILGASSCSVVGQVIAWTVTINGTGSVQANFNPNQLPYIKGLTQ
jgi:hypothetical protein